MLQNACTYYCRIQKNHPGIQFELIATDNNIDLIDNQIDIAVRVQAPVGADFVLKKLFENRLILCASPAFLRKTNIVIKKPEDLKKINSILTLSVYEKCKFINSNFELSVLKGNQEINCESGLFLTELALQGADIAVRSFWDVGQYIGDGILVQVLKEYPLESFGNMYAITPSKRLLASRVRVFLDFLTEKMNQKFNSLFIKNLK